MKNIIKLIITLFIVSISTYSCKDDIDIIESFPFEISENHRENLTINFPENTIFEVSPERIVTTKQYFFRYTIESGQGFYLDEQGKELPQNELILLEDLNFDYNFVGTEIGEVKVNIFVTDQEQEESLELVYNINQNQYNIDLNTISRNVTINEPSNFIAILNNQGRDQSVTYTARLFFSQGSGIIYNIDEEGEIIAALNQQETFNFTPGTKNYQVVLDKEGINILNFEIIDSNGFIQTETIEFAVNVINFNFTGIPEGNAANLGDEIKFNFNINETDGGNDIYQMSYVIDDGEGEIFDASTKVAAGTLINVPLGAFSWLYRPTRIGTDIFTFTAINTSGVSKSVTIQINVETIDFNFIATPEKNTTTLGNDITVNFDITEPNGGNSTYDLSYIVNSGEPQFFSGPSIIAPGNNFNVPLGAFNLLYRPTKVGTDTVTFTVKNTSGAIETFVLTITVEDRSFDFTATRSFASANLGETVDINYAITESGGNTEDNYTMVFSSSANGILVVDDIEYNAGQVIPITSLNFVAKYKGLEIGAHMITSTITAGSNNLSVPKDVQITFNAARFTLDVTSNVVVTVGERIPINFNIVQNAGISSFTIRYSFTGPQQNIIGGSGNSLPANTEFDITGANNFDWALEGLNQGTTNITFTVENQFGITESQTIRYTINPINFSFSTSPSGTQFLTDSNIRFNFNMSAPNTLSYQLSFDSNTNSTVIFNGITYNKNQKFTVRNTDFSVFYRSSNSGTNVITWTIEASNGVIRQQTNNITVNQVPVITSYNRINLVDTCSFASRNSGEIFFTKASSARIVSATAVFKSSTGSVLQTETRTLNLTNSSTRTRLIDWGCIDNTFGRFTTIEFTITDSNGFVSQPFIL